MVVQPFATFKFYANEIRMVNRSTHENSVVNDIVLQTPIFAAILKIDAAALTTLLIIDFKEIFASSRILVLG